MKMEKHTSFYPANILLPDNINMQKWAVVACDQYTSQPQYWQEVVDFVDNAPSAYNLVLPEIYLGDNDVDDKIKKINENMKDYKNSLLKEYKDCFIYIERTLKSGKVRKGLVGVIDLEDYEYVPGNNAQIRATEGTVAERIPPRVKVRENAVLELPHIMVLIDDVNDYVFGAIDVEKCEKVYDFDLMQQSGHLKGWVLKDTETFEDNLKKLQELNSKSSGTMLFAVGDGNHSLATAKACWDSIKESVSDKENHPARYALVEINNIHDNALEFEPIHRIVFNCDTDDIIKKLDEYCGLQEECIENAQFIEVVVGCKVKKLYIKNPTSNLTVGTLQNFLDGYIAKNNCEIDYIHGEDVVTELSKTENSIGFLLPNMDKSELFPTIIKDGILPRKTFSMGEAHDKRFYVEARKIVAED